MNLDDMIKEAVNEAVYVANRLGFGHAEVCDAETAVLHKPTLQHCLQVGQTRLAEAQQIILPYPPDGWSWGP